MKIFRWQGLAAFSFLFLLGWVFFSFFLDGLIKGLIEKEGSRILKTQIEVNSVSTSLPSQSAGLAELAVANPDDLMENAVEIESIRFNMDAGRAMQKKVVIDEMTVENIRLNQKRKTPAKPYRSAEKRQEEKEAVGQKKSSFGFGEILKIKSPEDILKSEKLETLEAVESAKKELEELKVKWEQKLETDLNPRALEETKQKIEALKGKTKGGAGIEGIASTVQELKSVQETIQGNLDNIKNLKAELEKDSKRAKKLVSDLKDMPQKDFERLKKKYSLDVKGGSNILGAILGDEVKSKIDLFWKYYEMISPYLNKGGEAKPGEEEEKYVRGKGVFVKFKEKTPYPDLLVKHARLSLNLFDTRIAGDLNDLSDNQKVYGKPVVVHFSSDENEKFDHFGLNVKLDRTQPVASDVIDLNVDSLKLVNVKAGDQASIEKGFANLKSSIQITGEKNMSATAQADLGGLSFKMAPQDDNEIVKAVSDTLGATDKFFVKMVVNGTRDNYSLDIDSDLDKVISGAVQKVAAGKIQEFEQKLKSSVFSSTENPLSGVNDSLGGFLKVEDLLGDKSSAWTHLLTQSKEGASPIPSTDKLPLPGELKKFKLPF